MSAWEVRARDLGRGAREYGGVRSGATGPPSRIFGPFPRAVMHGLKPLFLGLSLGLAGLGLAYAGLGIRGLVRGDPGAGVLLCLGLTAAVVGVAVWRVVDRMGNRD